MKKALADGKVDKAIHDYKSAMHAFSERGVELGGVRDDTMLYLVLAGSDLFEPFAWRKLHCVVST